VEASAAGLKAATPKGTPSEWGIVPAIVFGVAVIIILLGGWDSKGAFAPDADNFKLLAGFYVLAQAIERLVEQLRPFLPDKTPTGKANVALVAFAFSTVLGVAASAGLGLYFLDAVTGGNAEFPRAWDILVSGLLIAGGTAGLHELIGRIEKAKQQAAVAAAGGAAEAASTTAQAAQQAAGAAQQAADAAKQLNS
jgi:hypothetical protein